MTPIRSRAMMPFRASSPFTVGSVCNRPVNPASWKLAPRSPPRSPFQVTPVLRRSTLYPIFVRLQGARIMPHRQPFQSRPVYMARRGLIASGHYLAARAGQRMFDRGGNAIDAVVASGLALNLLEPHNNGLGGEVPILVYSASEKKVFSI